VKDISTMNVTWDDAKQPKTEKYGEYETPNVLVVGWT